MRNDTTDKADWPRFVIVNDFDFPGPHMVAQLTPIGYCYMDDRNGRYSNERFDGMSHEKTTASLQDFGFEVNEFADRIECRQVRASKALYHDGDPRKWQGESEFTLPLITKAPKRRGSEMVR